MADAQVAIDVLARDRASRVLETVGDKVEKSGKKAHEAGGKWNALGGVFSKLGSTVGGETGEVLGKLGEGLEILNEKQGRLGKGLMAAGGAVTGIGALLQSIGSKDKAAMQQFNAAADASGKAFEGMGEEVEKAVKSQEHFGHKAPDTIDATRILTQALGDPKKALEELSLVSDVAASKHESLADAATQVGKVYNGATKPLKEWGITMANSKQAVTALQSAQAGHQRAVENLAHAQRTLADIEAVDGQRKKLTIGQQIQLRNAHEAVTNAQEKLTTSTRAVASAQDNVKKTAHANTDAMDQWAKKAHGQASAAADTWSGKLAGLRAKIDDTAAAYGQKFGAAITAAGPILMAAGAAAQLYASRQEALAAKSAAAAVATEAETGAVETQGIASKATAAAQWLLNAAMDANPIGIVVVALTALAVGLVYAYKHSETFRQIVQTAFQVVGTAFKWAWAILQGGFGWLRDHWKLILSILTGPVGAAAIYITTHWDQIVGYFKKIPGRISSALTGMWDGLKSGFRAAVNWIIDKWNNFHLTIGGGSILGQKIPSVTLNTPDIPHLAAGGIVPKTPGGRLIVAGDGPTDEAVVPLDGQHGLGGGTHVHFHVQGFVGNEHQLGRELLRILNNYGGLSSSGKVQFA